MKQPTSGNEKSLFSLTNCLIEKKKKGKEKQLLQLTRTPIDSSFQFQ
jgi:hypothetical protein